MRTISSANVACGFHAGDPGAMRRAVASAKREGVAIGAHPGFPDLLDFGRRNIDASPGDVRDYVLYQVSSARACSTACSRASSASNAGASAASAPPA
jgi:UPF0271 protein